MDMSKQEAAIAALPKADVRQIRKSWRKRSLELLGAFTTITLLLIGLGTAIGLAVAAYHWASSLHP